MAGGIRLEALDAGRMARVRRGLEIPLLQMADGTGSERRAATLPETAESRRESEDCRVLEIPVLGDRHSRVRHWVAARLEEIALANLEAASVIAGLEAKGLGADSDVDLAGSGALAMADAGAAV
jgi:hypothetical protein